MAETIDVYGRLLNYVRISVTDRCNMRCIYCMPPEGVNLVAHEDILRYEEILQLCHVFKELGLKKIRFTGGEPLVRKGIGLFLIEAREQFPDMEIALTTNGLLLTNHLEELVKSNINSLNVSLDTLNSQKFFNLTKIDGLNLALDGIRQSLSHGIENIKLNTVLIKGFNDKEVPELLSFSKKEGVLLRFIEFMPLNDNLWSDKRFISASEITSILKKYGEWDKIEKKSPFDGPAKYYKNRETGQKVGIISAVSDHFCKSCNRLRVSATGYLKNCLFSDQDLPLRHLLDNKDNEALKNAILSYIKLKPECWKDIRKGDSNMSSIGG